MAKKSASRAKEHAFDPSLLQADRLSAFAALADVDDGAALVAAWVDAGNAEAVSEVAERGSGPARKAARRGLNVLKSRGVAVAERTRVAKLVRAQEPVVEAWMLAPDAAGVEAFAISSRPPAGRCHVCIVFCHPYQGIARIETRYFSQSGLKEYFSKLLPGAGYTAIRVPVDWARHRIAVARERHAKSGSPEPLGFSSGRDLLEPVSDTPPRHPFDEEGLELSDDDANELAKDSGALHQVPEFRTWVPSAAALREMLSNVGQKLSGKVEPGQEPDADLLTRAMREEVDAATDRYFAPQMREQIVDLMKDSALSVLSREGEHRALEVAAVIKVIQKSGLITDPPHEIGFLKGFFEKAVALMAAEGGGRLRIPMPRAPLSEVADTDEQPEEQEEPLDPHSTNTE